MQPTTATYLVFGATGGTGKHFISQALGDGHRVRVLVRTPAKLTQQNPELEAQRGSSLEVHQGSIADVARLDELVQGVDFVVSMLGDKALQKDALINTAFVKQLIPAMRRHGVKRFLYQAGGLSTPYKGRLSPLFWTLRKTLASSFDGQHKDNEAVMAYLAEEAQDIEWMVHRAGIGSDGPSKGTLTRSEKSFSIATHVDCASYSYRLLQDASAIHTADLSWYGPR